MPDLSNVSGVELVLSVAVFFDTQLRRFSLEVSAYPSDFQAP